MQRDRYALIGLGRARSEWFSNVANWAVSGSIPADFAKCVSVAEVKIKLEGLRPYSALIVEAASTGVSRELIEFARRCSVPTIVVGEGQAADVLVREGAIARLESEFSHAELLDCLATHISPIAPGRAAEVQEFVEELPAWSGTLVAVCGSGGSGTSTVAIALAQAFAENELDPSLVLLADFARHGEQAMLHDATEVAPSVEELVIAHKHRRLSTSDIRGMTFRIETRKYQLLLGLRSSFAWSSLSPFAVDDALGGLRRSFRTVVADITADFEGEDQGGSLDVEERNALSRQTALSADVVLVVGGPGAKGIHALARTIRDLLKLGVDATRIAPIVNRGPKLSSSKSEMTVALGVLVAGTTTGEAVASPIFLPTRRVEDFLLEGSRLPKQLTQPLIGVTHAVLKRAQLAPVFEILPPRSIEPGSFGVSNKAVGDSL